MIYGEEVGKILLKTQNEIKVLKSELENGSSNTSLDISNKFHLESPEDLHLLYNKLKKHLTNFEEKLQNNVENIIVTVYLSYLKSYLKSFI